MKTKNIAFVLLSAALFLTFNACQKSGSSSTTSDSTGTGGGGTGGGGGGTTPSYGMNCTSTIGGDLVSSYPVSYVPSITGSTISAVQMNFWLNGTDTSGATTYATSLTLNVYSCVTLGAALPSAAATVTVTSGLYGSSIPVTFNLSPALTVPTNCTAGQVPFAFEVVDNSGDSASLFAEVTGISTSCFMQESSSTTKASSGGAKAFTAAITSP